jgi:hypothetical protein
MLSTSVARRLHEPAGQPSQWLPAELTGADLTPLGAVSALGWGAPHPAGTTSAVFTPATCRAPRTPRSRARLESTLHQQVTCPASSGHSAASAVCVRPVRARPLQRDPRLAAQPTGHDLAAARRLRLLCTFRRRAQVVHQEGAARRSSPLRFAL